MRRTLWFYFGTITTVVFFAIYVFGGHKVDVAPDMIAGVALMILGLEPKD